MLQNPCKSFMHSSIFRMLCFLSAFGPGLFFSCANQGVGPGGGPRDSIPPVVLRSIPEPGQINVSSNQIEVVFNEYVVPDKLAEKLVVSPPLAQRPTIRTKGKGIQVKINEDLIPDRTYSVDFKDGIKDYNEGNKLESFRMIFSTGEKLDTLRIKGRLLNAQTLSPVENGAVTLYTIDNDTIFRTLRPDFVARTDKQGRFMFDNLPKTSYRMYGLVDGDNNLMYTQPTEAIAFVDSMLEVDAEYLAKTDTLIVGSDTLISTGYTRYSPDSLYCLLFTEKRFSQYIRSQKRASRESISLGFAEALTDSFAFGLTDYPDSLNWCYSEVSIPRDSVEIWISDSQIVAKDTLHLWVSYLKTFPDGANRFSTDTLVMMYAPPKAKKPRKEEPAEPENRSGVVPFQISSSLKGGDFDLDQELTLELQWPVDTLKPEAISFERYSSDTVTAPQPFVLTAVSGSKRKFRLDFDLAEATRYKLSIDSAAISSFTGIPNAAFEATFKTRNSDYYGAVILNIQGFEGNGVLYLLRHTDKEEVVDTLHINGTGEYTFKYVKPEKFRIKLLDDQDGNGQWTTGNLEKRQQPERVYYFPKVLKVRSNWESKESWLIDPTKIEPKVLIDDEPDKK